MLPARSLLALALVGLLAACGGGEAPGQDELAPLVGDWADGKGEVRLTVWEDASVRVRIASLHVDVLSRMERAREGFVIPLGGAWQTPARLLRKGRQWTLLWPVSEKDVRRWTLVRVSSSSR